MDLPQVRRRVVDVLALRLRFPLEEAKQEIVHALRSLWMANEHSHGAEPTQKTRPKKGKPVDIPIPTRKEVFDLMRSVTGKRSSATDDRSPKQ
jgi:hypothetical protein